MAGVKVKAKAMGTKTIATTATEIKAGDNEMVTIVMKGKEYSVSPELARTLTDKGVANLKG